MKNLKSQLENVNKVNTSSQKNIKVTDENDNTLVGVYFDMPSYLKRNLKLKCAAESTTMREVVISALLNTYPELDK